MTPLERVQAQFPLVIIEAHIFRGDQTLLVRAESWRTVALFLKTQAELDFNMLMDLTAVDYLNFAGGKMKPEGRFEVVAHFYSLKHNHRLRLKVPVTEAHPEIDSLADIWPSADWYEREIWDMYGIRFKGHSNLKRILMYEEFKGHPLRKDYPVNKRQPLIGPVN